VAGRAENVTTEDRWHLGSLTKAMTATVAGTLVEEGAVSWESTILDVFPEWEGEILPAYEDVRLKELLSHTAGILSDVTRTPSWPGLREDDAPLTEQRRRWSVEFLSVPPEAARGTHLYSNAGYVVAGAMLEKVTGVPWEALMAERLFGPLGMAGAGFGAPGTAGSTSQPWGHRPGSGGWVGVEPGIQADNPAALGPAGTVHAPMADLVRFVQAHIQGDRGAATVVSPGTMAILHTPAPGTEYALGWGRTTRGWAPGWVYVHHGSNTLWHATIWMAPEGDFGVISVVNAGGDPGFQAADEVAGLLIQRFLNR